MNRVLIAFAALLLISVAATAAAQPPAGVPPPAATLAPAEARRIFTDLLQRFFDAYARKDIDGMTALYHTGGQARFRRNAVLVEFDLRQIAIGGLTVRNTGADAGGGRARAIVDLKVTEREDEEDLERAPSPRLHLPAGRHGRVEDLERGVTGGRIGATSSRDTRRRS